MSICKLLVLNFFYNHWKVTVITKVLLDINMKEGNSSLFFPLTLNTGSSDTLLTIAGTTVS